jgi:hypothetical protein
VIAGADPMHPRVLRGGAFNNNPDELRCAYRNNNHPDNRNNNIGFRVVVSTFFTTSGLPRGALSLLGREEWRDLLLAVPAVGGPGQ